MNQVFNFQRAIQYSVLKFHLNRKKFLVSLGGALGLVFIVTFFMGYLLPDYSLAAMNQFHQGAYTLLIFAGAIWLAGHAYQDMNTSEKSINQIMIPASRMEKFVIPFIFTTIGWILFISLLYLFYAWVLNGMWGLLFGKSFGIFSISDLFANANWKEMIQSYFFIHSAFFLGGLAFKTYPLGKTLLTGFIVNVLFTSLAVLTVLILFGSQPQNFNFDNQNLLERYPEIFTEQNLRNLQNSVKVFFTTILPMIFYVAAYYKLKEREA